jgi:predicted Zn-dependent peptidase
MFKKEKLKNGITLLTENMTEVNTISIGIIVKSGSVFEKSSNNGVSHLIEHLVFKGSKNRTAKQIAEEMDLIGGQVNAFSAKEYTCFYARVTQNHLKHAVDILTDIVLNPIFDPNDFKKEKNVVLEEIKMYEDSPDEYIHDLLPLEMIREGSLRAPILGTPESLKNLGLEAVKEFYNNFYIPENIAISVSGNFNRDSLIKMLLNAISINNEKKASKINNETLSFNTGKKVIKKEIEQAHLLIGFPGIAQIDDKRYAFNMLNSILAGSMSSRIFQKVREEMGVAYSTFSYMITHLNGGLYAVYAACDPKNLIATENAIWEEIEIIKEKGITDKELEIAKNQYISSIYLGQESTYNRMLRMAKYDYYFGKQLSLKDITKKVECVTKEKIQTLAKDYLIKSKTFTLTLGKVED